MFVKSNFSILGPSAYDGTSRLPKEYQDILMRQMSTSTSADERESTEEVASKEIREADGGEDETMDNNDDKDGSKNFQTECEEDEEVENEEKGTVEEKSQKDGAEEPKMKESLIC